VSLEQIIVAVITKYPEPGKVKTRLTAALSPEHASRVHRVFLTHVVGRLKRFKPQALKIIYDPPDKLASMRDLLKTSDELLPQCPGDLGARLAHAADEIRASTGRAVLIFAVDSPDLPAVHIRRAAALLDDADVVLGPAEDGGYWCIGLSPRVDARRLLGDIAWSSGRERAQTRARAEALGYGVAEGDLWDDIDRPEDLKRLCRRLKHADDADDRQLMERLNFLPKDMWS
jgi:hypothetical protein